jgi:peroxiredoxin
MTKQTTLLLSTMIAAFTWAHAGAPPTDAAQTSPLSVGDPVPAVTVKTASGDDVSLRNLTATQPTAIIFYRGGWCPYCTKHLMALAEIEDELHGLGYLLLAISPDRPEKAAETATESPFRYRLLSDASASAARAFGLAFRVDDETVEMYKTYGIDLEDASGEAHHLLPVPAVFLTGLDGTITYAHADPDYKERLDPSAILDAARAALSPAGK